MLVKLALVAVFVYAASASVIDENELIDYVMEGYRTILNETSSNQSS